MPEWLLEGWAKEFSQILEMMTGEPFGAALSQSAAGSLAGLEWWQQTLSLGPGAELYAGAGNDAALRMGRKLLEAAGVDMIDDDSALSTYTELLQQSTSGLARLIGKETGKTVDITPGHFHPVSIWSNPLVIVIAVFAGLSLIANIVLLMLAMRS